MEVQNPGLQLVDRKPWRNHNKYYKNIIVIDDLTFKVKSLIPPWVESFPLNLCLQPVFLIWQEGYPHIRVTQAIQVTGCKVSALKTQLIYSIVKL